VHIGAGRVTTTVVRRTLVLAVVLWSVPAAASPDAWLDGLADRVIADVAAGRPVVVEVHAPLCDASIIPCGNARLGDGDNPETNLYWSTTPGYGRWFARRGGGWKRVARRTADATGDRDVLALDVYRRTVAAPAAWRSRGAPKRFDVVVVVRGWRGTAIDRALAAYAADLSGKSVVTVKLDDGSEIAAGGAAQIVAYSGHNRLMDVAAYDWPAPPKEAKGTIAVACKTAQYMADRVPGATRVPLLFTRDFLFANAAPVEAAILAFVDGGKYAAIRERAAGAYAAVQKKSAARVLGAFTNPADKRWSSGSAK
jgi:hypothetical protein